MPYLLLINVHLEEGRESEENGTRGGSEKKEKQVQFFFILNNDASDRKL